MQRESKFNMKMTCEAELRGFATDESEKRVSPRAVEMASGLTDVLVGGSAEGVCVWVHVCVCVWVDVHAGSVDVTLVTVRMNHWVRTLRSMSWCIVRFVLGETLTKSFSLNCTTASLLFELI